MVKKYTYPEEEPQMAKEDIAINYPSNSVAELNFRIDIAEQQMVDGDIVSGEFVHERMRNIIRSVS